MQIDTMDTATLKKHFATSGASPEAVEGLVKSYQKNPRRLLFRYFLKDCVRPGWEFMSLTSEQKPLESQFAGDFDDWNKG